MIYTHIILLSPLLLHVHAIAIGLAVPEELIFEGAFAIYGHGGHLDYMTWFIFKNIYSPFIQMLPIKFGFDLSSWFRDLCILWLYTCILPCGMGRATPGVQTIS